MTATGRHSHVMLLLCFISTAACNLFAFTDEPSERAGKSDGYCSRILRARSNRKEVNNEFRLRVEGDPESYHPGSTYRGWCLSATTTLTVLVGTICALSNKPFNTASRLCKLKITFYCLLIMLRYYASRVNCIWSRDDHFSQNNNKRTYAFELLKTKGTTMSFKHA